VFVSFLPIYMTTRGYTESAGSQTLTLFLLAGGTAGFLGGVLADRFGGRRIIAASMLGCLPMLLAFLWTRGPLSLLFCAAGGAFLLFTSPVNIVMAQKLVPEGASTVSALMMGFAWGMGGLIVPVVGILSDVFGLQSTMTGIVVLALPGFLLSIALPRQLDVPDKTPPAPTHEPASDLAAAAE
jgi:FSR family fosmidomycin resistance protein-like MFS transporter